MPSPRRSAVGWLLRKEWRELMASRSWWVLLGLIGPLVGVTFMSAVRTYAEISEGAGDACGAVCAPLIGIWTPTFSAYEIAAIFLLPFVAIRLVSGDRQSGALKLEIQRPMSSVMRLSVKVLVLLAGCAIAGAAGAIAIALWASYGGAVSWPELAVIGTGHLLHAALTIAIASLAAATTDHPATAAIVTLAVTVGTWVLQFAAAIYGGLWTRLAGVTPAALFSPFQHGLLPVGTAIAAIAIIVGALYAAAAWLRLGDPIRRRLTTSTVAAVVTTVVVGIAAGVPASWDASEGRLNSFPRSAERRLGQIAEPIQLEIHLAPEDPRRVDLERRALPKLQRAAPSTAVAFVSRTSTGLFEQNDPHYGEIRYQVGKRTVVGRATTEEAVLEAIFEAAGTEVDPDDHREIAFAGHPLVTRPTGAAIAFFGAWPAAAAIAAWLAARQRSPSRLR